MRPVVAVNQKCLAHGELERPDFWSKHILDVTVSKSKRDLSADPVKIALDAPSFRSLNHPIAYADSAIRFLRERIQQEAPTLSASELGTVAFNLDAIRSHLRRHVQNAEIYWFPLFAPSVAPCPSDAAVSSPCPSPPPDLLYETPPIGDALQVERAEELIGLLQPLGELASVPSDHLLEAMAVTLRHVRQSDLRMGAVAYNMFGGNHATEAKIAFPLLEELTKREGRRLNYYFEALASIRENIQIALCHQFEDLSISHLAAAGAKKTILRALQREVQQLMRKAFLLKERRKDTQCLLITVTLLRKWLNEMALGFRLSQLTLSQRLSLTQKYLGDVSGELGEAMLASARRTHLQGSRSSRSANGAPSDLFEVQVDLTLPDPLRPNEAIALKSLRDLESLANLLVCLQDTFANFLIYLGDIETYREYLETPLHDELSSLDVVGSALKPQLMHTIQKLQDLCHEPSRFPEVDLSGLLSEERPHASHAADMAHAVSPRFPLAGGRARALASEVS